MKRVRFNDVVEVKYFYKTKPLEHTKVKNSRFYIKLSIFMFLLLLLLTLCNQS